LELLISTATLSPSVMDISHTIGDLSASKKLLRETFNEPASAVEAGPRLSSGKRIKIAGIKNASASGREKRYT